MNYDQQRIAIAEAMGWSVEKFNGRAWRALTPMGAEGDVISRDQQSTALANYPDYVNDLNSLHDAELSLNHEEHRWFCNHLREACGNDAAISANAEVRTKCFLKAKNLWTGHD